MLNEIIGNKNKIVISTGNVLNVNKKAGQKPSEELFDCLKVTLNEPTISLKSGEIFRKNDDLHDKILENERDNIKIGVKIFLNNNSTEYLREAIEKLLRILNVNHLDNLILAYHPKIDEINGGDTGGAGNEPIQLNGFHNGSSGSNENGTTTDSNSNNSNNNNNSNSKEGVIEWGNGNANAFDDLKNLWSVLEEYAMEKKICQLGISDLDTNSLVELHQRSKVKPTIAQINLSACCVVPPPLQEFCTKNDIQLLTHSDPEEILTQTGLQELAVNQYTPTWITRYQIHIKCRGVLAAKGFVIGIKQK